MRIATQAGMAILFLAASTFGGDTLPAQGVEYRVVPHWAEGDTFQFEVSKTRSTVTPDAGSAVEKVSFCLVSRVVKADNNGYLLESRIEDFTVIEPKGNAGTAKELAAKFGRETPARFRVSNAGDVGGRIENWNEVMQGAIAVFDQRIASQPQEIRQRRHDAFVETLKDRSLQAFRHAEVLNDHTSWLGLNGVAYKEHAVPMAQSMPLPLGDNARAPAHVTREVVSQDEAQVVLRDSLETDPDAGKVVAELARRFDQANGRSPDIPKGAELMLSSKTVSEGTIDKKRGIAIAARFVMSIEVDYGKGMKTQKQVVDVREKRVPASRPSN